MTLLKYEKPFQERTSIDDEIAKQIEVESYFVKNAKVLEIPQSRFDLNKPENVAWFVERYSFERKGIPEIFYRTLLKLHRDNLDKKGEEK